MISTRSTDATDVPDNAVVKHFVQLSSIQESLWDLAEQIDDEDLEKLKLFLSALAPGQFRLLSVVFFALQVVFRSYKLSRTK